MHCKSYIQDYEQYIIVCTIEKMVELPLSAHVWSCPFASSPAHLARSCLCCWLTCLPCVPSAGEGGEEEREGVGGAAHCWTAVLQVCTSAATNQLFTLTNHYTKQQCTASGRGCQTVSNRAMYLHTHTPHSRSDISQYICYSHLSAPLLD